MGRSLAAAAGTALLVTGLVGTATAAPLPSPSESPSESPSKSTSESPSASPSESPAPSQVAPSPSPSPTPNPYGNGNQPPQVECPGVVTQAEATEAIRVSALDPDGDPVTLSVATSMFGVEATVAGHVVTYTAPSGLTGQDSIPVTAEDGKGGSAHCEIAVLVQNAVSTPTPSPTSASSTPAPEPSTSAPAPPRPAPEPTSATPTTSPTPRPTSTAAPTSAPTSVPGGSAGSGSAPRSTPGTGVSGSNGSGTGTEAPGGSAPGGSGSNDGGPGSDNAGSGSDNASPGTNDGGPGSDNGGTSSDQQGAATAHEKFRNIIDDATVQCPLRAVSDAERLIKGLSAGMALRPDGGNFANNGAEGTGGNGTSNTAVDTPSANGGDSTEPAAGVERMAETGSSIWLFAGVGALMLVLIGLALAALPSRRGRH